MGRWLARRAGLAAVLLMVGSSGAEAQLRPLPPLEWDLFDAGHVAAGRIGGSVLVDQRASLAGTQGRLMEIGNFDLALRTGRVAVQVGGTMLRLFDDQRRFAEPYGGALAGDGERRRDAGDFRISTVVLLTPPEHAGAAVIRFGTRLPTTDNEVGLDRDRTDFFALLGGRLRAHGFLLSGEAGVGINGTHEPQLEQSDVLMYSATAAHTGAFVSPRVSLVGHFDGMSGLSIRGNEELAEVRLGARFGREVWGQAEVVYGLQPFSPRTGLLVSAGIAR